MRNLYMLNLRPSLPTRLNFTIHPYSRSGQSLATTSRTFRANTTSSVASTMSNPQLTNLPISSTLCIGAYSPTLNELTSPTAILALISHNILLHIRFYFPLSFLSPTDIFYLSRIARNTRKMSCSARHQQPPSFSLPF